MVSMNILTKEKRIQVLRALVEGNSIRATVRITGVAKNTVVKLLRDAGIVFYGKDHGGGKVFMTASINDADLELDHNFEGSFATIEMNIYKDGDFPHFVSMTGRLKTMNVGIENKNDASRHFRGNMSLRGGKFLDDVQSPVGSGHISAILSLSRTRRANAAFENVTSVLDGITAELLDRGYHNLENDVPVPEPPR